VSSFETKAEPIELWDRATVLQFFGGSKPIHVSTLYRGVISGLYPSPVNVAPNAVRWVAHECREAQQRMLLERNKSPKWQGRGRPPRLREATAQAVK
jgi:predicted DNA-binding transcriptional regulator AlpA